MGNLTVICITIRHSNIRTAKNHVIKSVSYSCRFYMMKREQHSEVAGSKETVQSKSTIEKICSHKKLQCDLRCYTEFGNLRGAVRVADFVDEILTYFR